MDTLTQYINVFSVTEWLMSAVVVVLIMSLISIKRQRKLQLEQNLSMQSLQRDLRALANAAVGVGGRVLEIERHQRKRPTVVATDKVSPQSQPQQSVPINHAAPVDFYTNSNQPYEQAIRMAQTGATTDDIINVCGLSKSEAELVAMMHRLDQAS